MSPFAVIGWLLLLVGIFLIGFGTRAAQTVTNKLVQGVTGHFTRNTMWTLIGGGLLVLIGAALLYYGW